MPTVYLFQTIPIRHTDDNGAPAPGVKLHCWAAGTNVNQAVYTDSTGTTQLPNPVVGDDEGFLPDIWGLSASYDLECRAADDATVLWTAENVRGSGAFLADLANTTSAGLGSGMIGYSQTLAYAAGTNGAALRQTITAKTAGLDISGDVAAGLTSLFALAVSLNAECHLTAGRTYRCDTAPTIPAGLVLVTHGAILEDHSGSGSATPFFLCDSAVSIDQLKVTIPAGVARRRAVVFTGDQWRVFGDITVESVDQQPVSVNDDAGVRISGSSGGGIGGTIRVTNYDNAIQFLNSDNCGDVNVLISSFLRAILVEDSSIIRLHGHIHTTSPNASYSPGHVGVLIQCNTAGATHHIYLEDLLIEDSGEHGVRVAGPEEINYIYVSQSHFKNCGGSGLKVLGTDAGAPTETNKHIYISHCTFEDCGTGGLTSNMCGLLLMFCAQVVVDSCSFVKTDKAQSGFHALRLAKVSDVKVNNCDFADATQHGIHIDDSLGDNTRVTITGGIARTNGLNGIRLDAAANTSRRIIVDGLVTDSNGGYGAGVLQSGGGALVGCKFRTLSYVDTSGPVSCNSTAVAWNGSGIVPGVPAWTAADGSLFQDEGNNTYVMKAAAWTAVA